MRPVYPVFAALLLLCLGNAQAQPLHIKSSPFQTPLLELYTSEGCSSCPPAERWMGELIQLAQQEFDVLALAFHVDYWDYIGWKDPYASPQHSRRQRALASANGQSSIYTPEFLLNDREIRGTGQIVEKIRQGNRTISPVQLELIADKQPHSINLQLTGSNNPDKDLQVEFIVFENDLSSQVDAGENAGRILHHQQVVRYLSPVLAFSPEMKHQIKIRPDWQYQHLGIAVIVRSADKGFIQSLYSTI